MARGSRKSTDGWAKTKPEERERSEPAEPPRTSEPQGDLDCRFCGGHGQVAGPERLVPCPSCHPELTRIERNALGDVSMNEPDISVLKSEVSPDPWLAEPLRTLGGIGWACVGLDHSECAFPGCICDCHRHPDEPLAINALPYRTHSDEAWRRKVAELESENARLRAALEQIERILHCSEDNLDRTILACARAALERKP